MIRDNFTYTLLYEKHTLYTYHVVKSYIYIMFAFQICVHRYLLEIYTMYTDIFYSVN